MSERSTLETELWRDQSPLWPTEGRHILAHHDLDSVVVYQAYRPEIAAFAVENQRFGGPWSFNRMSWIKPNFLWMMYRCGWASKPGQERVLALWLKRAAFERILSLAMNAKAPAGETTASWREKLSSSEVRLQWDPDHDPHGEKCPRRAIQLGLRGQTLRSFSQDWLLQVRDITPFVHAQVDHVAAGRLDLLETPRERVYRTTALATDTT